MFNRNEPQRNSLNGKRGILLPMPQMQNSRTPRRQLCKQSEPMLKLPSRLEACGAAFLAGWLMSREPLFCVFA